MKKNDRLSVLMICAMCLLLMLPRILSAHFGLLDDAVLLLNSVQSFRDAGFIIRGFSGAGRFIPTTLLFRAVAFYFSGFDPQRWYIWQTIILTLICLELALIVRSYVPGRLAAVTSVLFFLASPTLIENFYTLSKAEVYLLVCMTSAILMSSRFTASANRAAKIFVVTASFTFLLLSFGTKETALILPFIFLAWLLISWIYFRRNSDYREFLQSDLILLVGSLVGGAIYLTFRYYVLGLTNPTAYTYVGEYQLLNFLRIRFNSEILLGWLMRDFLYLVPILLAAIIFRPLRQMHGVFIMLRWIVWMIAWLAILLPWGYLAYYFLPFSLGAAVLSGTILSQMFALWRSEPPYEQPQAPPRPINKNWLRVFCIITLVLAIPSTINATAYATGQLTFDRANWLFVVQVSQLPRNSRLLVNISPEMEYLYEIQLYADRIFHRTDILIEAYQAPVLLSLGQDTYIASPYYANQVLPRVRAIDGSDVEESRQALMPTVRDLDVVYSARIERPVLDIGLHRVLFFLDTGDMMGYSDRSIFTNTSLVYGWDMWKYPP